MAVLVAQIALALGHSIHLLYTHKTSNAWDSIAEILTLANNPHLNSQALQHTSAGIRSLETYKEIEVVRVTEPRDQAEKTYGGRIELVFCENGGSGGTSASQKPAAPDIAKHTPLL
ncbi:hypothetical protein BGZ61DRAFT_534593 [Ilyonectria robusta]|uniref:uncharacterized protein n=1 Tax=Ilyonectria robusta TaxID=1079257 RepID=UPI001E8CC456|nr:uncharacterized protein BGZ61DRAFT_534593 [Ilyonectria robusta]KAH8683904.1 hypothetical protein BGZ61DRAFT_534593 [Ilyonectria robusta]